MYAEAGTGQAASTVQSPAQESEMRFTSKLCRAPAGQVASLSEPVVPTAEWGVDVGRSLINYEEA